MRRWILISLLLIAAFVFAGCKRRPLVEVDNNVFLNITFEEEIVNYEMEKHPEMMRAIFYDSETGDFVSQSFHITEEACMWSEEELTMFWCIILIPKLRLSLRTRT